MTWEVKSLNGPSLIAGVNPTLDYRFGVDQSETEAISLTDKLTFTRSSAGTFTNSSGLIDEVASNVPRFDYSSSNRGLLIEPSSTNLCTYSSNFSQWITGNPAVNEIIKRNAEIAPDGTLSAVESRVTLYGGLVRSIPITSGVTYRVSVWLKAKSGVTYQAGGVTVGVNGVSTTNYGATLNSYKQWFRATHTCTATSTNYYAEIFFGRGGGTGQNFYAWGPQIEVGSTATSFIKTGASAVTRAADSASINGTGVITGTYTMVEKPAGCAVVSGTNIDLVSGYAAERVMVFPVALTGPQITSIRAAM